MKGIERRKKICRCLAASSAPVSGAALAALFSVSRQVIVQDMALLRAEGLKILSTNRGYLLISPCCVTRTLKAFHTDEEIEDELNTIVDLGGTAVDVFVHHRVYGRLQADLQISSRKDVQSFLEKLKSGKSAPLNKVTSGYHYHTISADSEKTLDLIEEQLRQKGYLCPERPLDSTEDQKTDS